jgi:hypothetical protein
MYTMLIGDSPDHIVNLNMIHAILEYQYNTLSNDSVLSLSKDLNLTKDQIFNLKDWVHDIMHIILNIDSIHQNQTV